MSRRQVHPTLASFSRAVLFAAPAFAFPTTLEAQSRHVLSGSAIIWNLAGEVKLEPTTESDVIVEVTRGGRDASSLDVHAEGGRLRIRYPDEDIVYRGGDGSSRSSTTLHVQEDGTFGGNRDGGGRRTRVATYGDGLEVWADLRILVPKNKRVEVHLAVGHVTVTNVDGDVNVDVHSASTHATGVKGRMSFEAGSGSIRVESSEGELEIDTGSGSTRVTNFRGRHIVVDAGSGGFEGSEIVIDRLVVDVGSGRIRVAGLRTDGLKVETGSGSVDIDLTKVPEQTEIDTGSGSVRLTLPSNANAMLDIDTGSGGISTEFPVQTDRLGRRELRGNIGAGGPLIRVNTGSGGVRLLRR